MKYAAAWAELRSTIELFAQVNHDIGTKDVLELLDSLEEIHE